MAEIELADGGVRFCNYNNGIRHGLSRDVARSGKKSPNFDTLRDASTYRFKFIEVTEYQQPKP